MAGCTSLIAQVQRHAVGTELSRARYDGQQLHDLQRLFTALPKVSGGRHFGARIRFLGDGTLLLTLGDRGDRPQAQRTDTHLGGTIRLTDEGRIPQDNPFKADPKTLPALYTYGHRNAQGLAIHPNSGQPWLHEHGPQGGDEINILYAGDNYGWPLATYGRNYFTGTQNRTWQRGSRDEAAGVLLGAIYRTFRDGFLHRQPLPSLARQFVYRCAKTPIVGTAGTFWRAGRCGRALTASGIRSHPRCAQRPRWPAVSTDGC